MTPTTLLRHGCSAVAVSLAVASVALLCPSDALRAQKPVTGDAQRTQESRSSGLLHLRAGTFDPLEGGPLIPAELRAGADVGLFIVQFASRPTDAMRDAVRAAGGEVHGYLPDDAYVVRSAASDVSRIRALPSVRFVGAYEPAYRLDPRFVNELLQGEAVGTRRYNFVVVDKRQDKPALSAAIEALGGGVFDTHEGSILFTADLTQAQLFAAARLDQVLWIDLWSAPEEDMDNARIQGGGNYVETAGNYTGTGVRGHVYEGVEANHPDFTTPMTNVASSGAAQSHGHCTAGIVFGNGTSSPAARGMAPDAVGYYTNYNTTSGSRNSIVGTLVNTHQVMFTTASWGNARTANYTSVSADADDIIFDHRIPWTQSQSNAGNTQSRPQAWAKNIFSIGGVDHNNNSSAADDSWQAGNGSTGPAADGRIKPDLCAYYDSILTSDRTGSAGYTNGNTYSNFGGTSGATPIVAGHNAIAIQMYAEGLFGSNTIRVPGGTTFQNRPLAQTLKALMIVGANQYSFNASSSDNRREHQGWGFPNLRNLYDSRDDIFIVPEDRPLAQGATDSFTITVDPNEPELKVCMTYVEPAGNPAASLTRINDLSLRVTSPSGQVYFGNAGLRTGNYSTLGGSFDTVDPVECVFVQNPNAGTWVVEVVATSVVQDTELSTPATDASYALAVRGGSGNAGPAPEFCNRYLPDNTPGTGTVSAIPFGDYVGSQRQTNFAGTADTASDGAIYFDIETTDRVTLNGLSLNMSGPLGSTVSAEIFILPKGTSVFGNETNRPQFALRSRANGFLFFQNFPSELTLEEPITLNAGRYGVAIVASGFSHRFVPNTGAQTFGSGVLRVLTGSASDLPFQAPVQTGLTPSVRLDFTDHSVDNAPNSNVRYQTILRSNELGDAGTITSLAFAANWDGVHASDLLEVRMASVPAGWTLLSNMGLNALGSQLVLSRTDHTWMVRADDWNSIGLSAPFVYDGQSDVVVEILVQGNALSESGAGFRAASNRPRVVANNWTGAVPGTANLMDNDGLEMRVQFGCADAQSFGTGCGGMELEVTDRPIFDQVFEIESQTELASAPIVLHFGVTNGGLFPLHLDSFGFPDCVLWNDAILSVSSLTAGDGKATFGLVAPNDPNVSTTPIYVQTLQLNANMPGGITASNYARIVIGSEF